MELTGAAVGVMLAIAAALWFVYLVPTWLRRREYLATERNAVRLQQTLRVLAETAEVPERCALEATAREAAQQQRTLRQAQRPRMRGPAPRCAAAAPGAAEHSVAAEIERAARTVTVTSDRVVEQRPVAPAARPPPGKACGARVGRGPPAASRASPPRVRWSHGVDRVAARSWAVLALRCGCRGDVDAAGIVWRAVSRARALLRRNTVALRKASGRWMSSLSTTPVREWTPVPVPKPLYLEHQQAPRVPVAPAASAEELLRAAAVEAERALAAAHAEPEVVPFPARPAAPSAPSQPSRYASMGIVDSGRGSCPTSTAGAPRRRRLG